MHVGIMKIMKNLFSYLLLFYYKLNIMNGILGARKKEQSVFEFV